MDGGISSYGLIVLYLMHKLVVYADTIQFVIDLSTVCMVGIDCWNLN